MKKEKFGLILVLALFFSLIFMFPSANAAECEYGEVKARARTMDENGEWGEWQNATATPTLKIGEPFWIKTTINTTEKSRIALGVYEPGETKAFEVAEGPSEPDEAKHLGWKDANWSNTYQWKLKTTGNWTYGNAPLNILVQFTVEEYGDYYDDKVEFSIINAYISGEEWQGTAPKETGERGPSAEEGTGGEEKANQGNVTPEEGGGESWMPLTWTAGAVVVIIVVIGGLVAWRR